MKEIARVIRTQNPDILGVLETVGWGENDEETINKFSKTVALPHRVFTKANTQYDMTLFSRVAPREAQSIREGLWHAVTIAIYDIASLGEVAVTLLHLNPKDEDSRIAEIEVITELLHPYPYKILMGDFNSLSPHDPYNREELRTLFEAQGLTKFGSASLRFDCIRLIEERGFVDAMTALCKPFTPTVPTPANKDSAHAAPLRLDYLFVSQELQPFLQDARIVCDADTDRTSDHYPIVVDLNLNF